MVFLLLYFYVFLLLKKFWFPAISCDLPFKFWYVFFLWELILSFLFWFPAISCALWPLLYCVCTLLHHFVSAFNIFLLFTYQKKIKNYGHVLSVSISFTNVSSSSDYFKFCCPQLFSVTSKRHITYSIGKP